MDEDTSKGPAEVQTAAGQLEQDLESKNNSAPLKPPADIDSESTPLPTITTTNTTSTSTTTTPGPPMAEDTLAPPVLSAPLVSALGTPPVPPTPEVTESQELIEGDPLANSTETAKNAEVRAVPSQAEPTPALSTPLPTPAPLPALAPVVPSASAAESQEVTPLQTPTPSLPSIPASKSPEEPEPHGPALILTLPPPPSTTVPTTTNTATATPMALDSDQEPEVEVEVPEIRAPVEVELGEAPEAVETAEAGEAMEIDDAEASATCLWGDCGRLFTDLKSLIDHIHNDHVGVHKSNYTCEWATCARKGLAQTSRFALISHIRSHTGEKPFLCELAECDKAFTRSDALAKHMRLQHNMDPPPPGRGGNRKRKRGQQATDEPTPAPTPGSISASVSMSRAGAGSVSAFGGGGDSALSTPGGAASLEGRGGTGVFNTFKVEAGGVLAEREGRAGYIHLGSGGRGTNGYPRGRSLSPPIPPMPAALRHSVSTRELGGRGAGHAADEDSLDPPASFFTAANLPAHLQPFYDPISHTVHGRRVSMAMYLCMKAKYQYALEDRRLLEEELREARAMLEMEKMEKERVLDGLLLDMFGEQAEMAGIVGEVVMPLPDGIIMVGGNPMPMVQNVNGARM